ncbi:MAG: hypothetical protein C4521_06620 [Actinobacteria bacterium]|nr:MAG: hypothetical protein C4521_06620 [Actinomycetota bacterium]
MRLTSVHLVEEQDASPEVRAIYEEIKQYYKVDFVPNIFKVQARQPQTLKQVWEAFKQAEATFSREIVHIIGLSTAMAMSSPYTIDAHTAGLRQLGYDDEKIYALVDHIAAHIGGDASANGLQLEPDMLRGIMRKGIAA